jgi:hypothetical protein
MCWKRNSLSPWFQAWRVVDDKCMCVPPHLVGHSSLRVFVEAQNLVVHNGIFVWVPYPVGGCAMPLHVLCAKAKGVLQSIPFCHTPFWMRGRPDVIFQRLHVSLNRIHPPAMDRSAYEQLFHEMHRKMRHDIQKCRRELLFKHTRCHDNVPHESIQGVLSYFLLTYALENSAHFDDSYAHLLGQQIPDSHR